MHRAGKARCMAISTAPRPIPLIGGLGTHPAPGPRSGECDAQNHAVVSRCARKEAARWQATISAARSYRAGRAARPRPPRRTAPPSASTTGAPASSTTTRASRASCAARCCCPATRPEHYLDRGELWNAVEESERRSDSQLAREFKAALPRELSRDDQWELARSWAERELVGRGMCADLCMHDRGDGNPHVHIMATTREYEPVTDRARENEQIMEWNALVERPGGII